MIIVECYNDEALMYRIGFSRDQVRHESGRSRVLGRVEQAKGRIVGIIDEDPQTGKPSEMKEYELKGSMGSIRLLGRVNDSSKSLIQMSPRLENWLYEIARRNKIHPEDYGLSSYPEVFHNISGDKDKFRRFLMELNRAKDDEIEQFKRWIREAITEVKT